MQGYISIQVFEWRQKKMHLQIQHKLKPVIWVKEKKKEPNFP